MEWAVLRWVWETLFLIRIVQKIIKIYKKKNIEKENVRDQNRENCDNGNLNIKGSKKK